MKLDSFSIKTEHYNLVKMVEERIGWTFTCFKESITFPFSAKTLCLGVDIATVLIFRTP